MTRHITLQHDVISIRVPIKIRRHGGKKFMLVPGRSSNAPLNAKPDETLIRALAKARHWQDLIDNGTYRTVDDLAKSKTINPSYASRILRLNQLAPAIKRAILDGTQPPTVDLQTLQKPFSDLWDDQLKQFGMT